VSDEKLWDESPTSRHLQVLYHQTSFQRVFAVQTTDLKLWRCLLHRLDLMQLKFCVNLNKIFEVIPYLVMTVFFVSSCS